VALRLDLKDVQAQTMVQNQLIQPGKSRLRLKKTVVASCPSKQQDNSIQIDNKQDGVVQGAAETGHVELHCVGPSDFWRGAKFDGTAQSNTAYKGAKPGMVQGVVNESDADSGDVVQSGARLAIM